MRNREKNKDSHSLTYYLQDNPTDWDGTSVKIVDSDTEDESVAIVKFIQSYAHMFGAPNEEAFSGHPLSDRVPHFVEGVAIHDECGWER